MKTSCEDSFSKAYSRGNPQMYNTEYVTFKGMQIPCQPIGCDTPVYPGPASATPSLDMSLSQQQPVMGEMTQQQQTWPQQQQFTVVNPPQETMVSFHQHQQPEGFVTTAQQSPWQFVQTPPVKENNSFNNVTPNKLAFLQQHYGGVNLQQAPNALQFQQQLPFIGVNNPELVQAQLQKLVQPTPPPGFDNWIASRQLLPFVVHQPMTALNSQLPAPLLAQPQLGNFPQQQFTAGGINILPLQEQHEALSTQPSLSYPELQLVDDNTQQTALLQEHLNGLSRKSVAFVRSLQEAGVKPDKIQSLVEVLRSGRKWNSASLSNRQETGGAFNQPLEYFDQQANGCGTSRLNRKHASNKVGVYL